MNADAMSAIEDDAGGPAVNVERVDKAGRKEVFLVEAFSEPCAKHSFAKIKRTTIGIDITEPDEKIGIGCVALDPEPGADPAGDFGGLGERIGGEDEEIVTGFDGVLVHGTGGEGELDAADGGDWICGIVVVGERRSGLVFSSG